MSKRSYPFPYKTVSNNLTLDVSLLSIGNITIQSPNTFPTYTLTLPPNDGSPGQILSTDGNGVLSWVNDVSGGTVTSVSATVPAWLSVTVSNPTTTPAIAITGTSTGTGTVTVLQNDPTITTKLTLTRTSSNGEAVRIHNAQASPQKNYIEIGHNSNNHNHAHFGHNYLLSNDAGNYAYMQTGGKELCWDGNSRLFSDSLVLAAPFTGVVEVDSSMTIFSNYFTLEGTSAATFEFRYVRPSTGLVALMGRFGSELGSDDFFFETRFGTMTLRTVANQPIKLLNANTGKQAIFGGAANFTFPTSEGTAGQSLITNGLGVTSWADRVSSVSATVPSFMSVTVTNPNTTPAIAISATSTGTGSVVLATSPTISTPTLNNFATVAALSGQNDAGTLIVRGGTDVYISKYKSGAGGQLNNAFMITTNPANPANTFFYTQGSSVGIFSQSPQETLDVQGSIRASNFIRFNNVNVYPGSSGVLSLYLPTSTGTSGQVLTSTGSGTAMTWTTPATGTVTSVAATSPLASSGGATPTISLSTVPTTLGGTGLTTVGTNGQVLTSNGTSLNWTTPATGTVTSVAATSPLASSGGATPTISIASSTGTGSVVLNNGPTFDTQFYLDSPGTNDGYLRFTSVANANYIQSALQPTTGSTADFKFTDYNAANTWMTIAAGGNVGIGTTSPGTKFVVEGAPASFGIQYLSSTATLSTTINTIDILQRWYESTGNASYIDLSWIRTSAGGTWDSAGQRFQAKTDTTFQGYLQFNGDNNHGLSFGTGVSTTAHGVAERMRIDGSGNVGILGNVGIGTISPAYTLDVNRSGVGIPQFAVREGFFGGFRTQWNYSAGQGETTFFDYRGAGAGGFWFKNLDTSNADVGWASISGGLGYFNGDGENLILDGATHSYLRWRVGNVNYGFFGYTSGGTQTIALYNQRPTGDLAFDMANTNGLIRFYKPIVIENVVTVKKAPSSSVFDFILPSDPGTAGQYLISGGAGAAMYWGSGGGGGGGSVNSVTASAPLASSGGTAPNISIASATGTGAVVLDDSPTVKTPLIVTDKSGSFLNANIQVKNSTQTYQISCRGDSSNVFAITDETAATFRMVITTAGNVGIGTTTPTKKLDVVGAIKANQESHFSDGTFSDPDTGNAYNAKFGNTTSNSNGIAVKGNSRFTDTVRANNFTTNGTNTFTYASGTFTPRIAMFYTSDGKVYECNSAPPGKDNITITYSVQTGVWVRVGNLVTVNMEIQYSQTYAGITFDMTNLNIVAVIPEAACNPSALGAVGVTGYPSRIADRFVDNFQMNYWISNTSYAPGGTICEVQLRRDNTHNMLPWDPTNKSGQRVNITTSYYVNQ